MIRYECEVSCINDLVKRELSKKYLQCVFVIPQTYIVDAKMKADDLLMTSDMTTYYDLLSFKLTKDNKLMYG